MNTIDLTVIAAYIAGCTALGAWLGSRSQGLKGYFLAESDIPAWAVMISIVATETSIATFLSVPGVAYSGNFTYLQLGFGYILGRVVVATVLLPAYFRGKIFTAYQLLQDRFGGSTRTTASILFLVARSLGDGLRLFLAATVLQHLTGWTTGAAIVTVAVITVIYTFLGGMKAVIWTDVIQFSVYIVGAVVALMILVGKLPGGWSELLQTARSGDKLHLFDFSFTLSRPYTFWAGLIGGMVLNTATHGADQMMVQRYLSARSQRQAAGALVASGFVILTQFALFLFIGVSLWVFYRVFPAADTTIRSDERFTYFIIHYLPTGVLGLVIAAIFSAAMGTLAGSLNSSASTIVNDLYRPFTGQSDERHLLRVGRVMTVVWGVVLSAVAFGAQHLEDNVVNNALAIASFVSGILLGLFLLGILTRRVRQSAALVGVFGGLTAVSFAKFATPLAFPWFALVGSFTVFVVGLAASFMVPGQPAAAVRGSHRIERTILTLEDHLLTESRNALSESIDTLSPLEIVRLINSEDAKVVEAVGAEAGSIAQAIDWAADRLGRGGRLVYVGAGTSGRLGVLDAAECPPTFSTPPEMVVGVIAGGLTALTRAVEGAEDDPDRGASDITALEVGKNDLVVGIATSGRTPYVLGAVREARRRGACTVGLACNRPSLLGAEVDLEIAPLVGAEIISGSTRLKAGTATKMILNMISTGAMVRIGKTLGNRMVDLKPSNEKLRIRSRRILREMAGVDDALAAQILLRCEGHLKRALVVALTGVDPDAAQTLLENHGGQVRAAVKAGGGRKPL